MDAVAQVTHECETCTAIKQAKWIKPLWYGGQCLKPGRWIIPHSHKRRGIICLQWQKESLDAMSCAPCHQKYCTILGLEKQILWQHDIPERTESENGAHFQNSLITTQAKEQGIEVGISHPLSCTASEKNEQYSGWLKTTPRAIGAGTLRHWDTHLAKDSWLVNTPGSAY